MNHSLGNEVIEFTTEFEKFTSDVQFLVEEFKEEVQKTLNEFRHIQVSQTERIKNIEDEVQNEVQNLKELFKDVDQKFEVFKQETSNLFEKSLNSSTIDSDKLKQYMEEHGFRLSEIAELRGKLSQLSNFSPEKLREELITGIRMLGDRVSKAIEEMNERIDNFSDEFQEKTSFINKELNTRDVKLPDQDNEEFASLKESNLFDVNEYEIVPREAVNKLTELYKKQSTAMKNFIEKHENRISEFDQFLRNYEEENTRLLELLDRRVKRNFVISIAAVIIILLGSIAIQIF